MAEHTPTPWSYKLAKFCTDGEFDCGISTVIDGKTYCIGETVGRCAPEIRLPAETNAAFIVMAVNNHTPLVDLLTKVRRLDWASDDGLYTLRTEVDAMLALVAGVKQP